MGYSCLLSELYEGALQHIPKDKKTELINIWHTSKIPYSGRAERLKYTVDQFIKKYPEYRRASVYKHLTRIVQDY